MSLDTLIGGASHMSSSSSNSTSNESTNYHKVEGTIVITALATHKNASIISPFVLDPLKAVAAWNYMYPKEPIETDPQKFFDAAVTNYKKPLEKQSTIDLLSGCTKASSFVGFVHLLKEEYTSQKQVSKSKAQAAKTEIEANLWIASLSGSFGSSSNSAKMSKSLNSTSEIHNHATLECNGLIPNISASDVSTVVYSLNPDPSENMAQLAAIQQSSNDAVNGSMESQAGEAKAGAQYQQMNSDYVGSAASALNEVANDNNKVIDTNSMMTAFTDFCEKVMEGDCGVPINFYLKQLTKADIAKCYIRKFYPNGATSAADARRGMMGQAPAEGGDDSGGGN